MIEWLECDEDDCDALVDVTYRAAWEKQHTYCRWHARRPKESKPQSVVAEPSEAPAYVSDRVGECFYCGFEEHLTRDHVIPKSEGKQFKRPWNTVWACGFCNQKKANLQLAEWLGRLDQTARLRGRGALHPKYERILLRSREFVSHLLTDPSHVEMTRYRIRVDPWFGESDASTRIWSSIGD